MNIFALDNDPEKAAQFLGDKHIGKMLLESVQLLCTALHSINYSKPIPYKPYNKNGRFVRWLLLSEENINWLVNHAKALANEYRFRFGKEHKSEQALKQIIPLDLNIFKRIERTQFAICEMPISCYSKLGIVESYRNYYRECKKHLHIYKHGRNKPNWL